MFDNDNRQETKKICDYILDDTDINDVLFEYVPVDDTLNYPSPPDSLPSFSDILLPKNKSKKKAAKKIFKKYQKMRQNRDRVKKAAKKAIQKLKKARYIQTDDTQTVNYNVDVNTDDLTTVGYTSDAEIENLSNAEAVDYTNNNTANSVTQQQAKRIIKKCKNLKRKATKNFDQTTKKKKKMKRMMTSCLLNKYPYILGTDKLGRQEKKMIMTSCLLNKYHCILGIGKRENQKS